MKKCRLLAVILALVFILARCNSNNAGSNTGEMPESRVEETSADKEMTERGDEMVTAKKMATCIFWSRRAAPTAVNMRWNISIMGCFGFGSHKK